MHQKYPYGNRPSTLLKVGLQLLLHENIFELGALPLCLVWLCVFNFEPMNISEVQSLARAMLPKSYINDLNHQVLVVNFWKRDRRGNQSIHPNSYIACHSANLGPLQT